MRQGMTRMTQKKSNTKIYILALLLFVGGLGALVASGLSENSVYFLNVSEALAMPAEKLTAVRMFGQVDERDLSAHQGMPGVTFRLIDKEDPSQTLMVEYKGAVPDTFKPGVEVIVEGALDKSGGQFTASTLITKCPSKYEKQNRQEG